jgi:hypothetical protein
MAALRVNSTFRQEVVGEVEVAPDDDASLVARFLKRSGPAGKVRDVRAKVVIRQVDGGALLVVEETDEVTENVGVAGWRNECEATASRVVNELPEVKRVEDDARNAAEESDGQARFGDLGPIDDDTHGGFSVGIGIHTDERFQPEIWYSVDPAGHLSVTVLGADATVSPSSLRAVERVCKR